MRKLDRRSVNGRRSIERVKEQLCSPIPGERERERDETRRDEMRRGRACHMMRLPSRDALVSCHADAGTRTHSRDAPEDDDDDDDVSPSTCVRVRVCVRRPVQHS